jgi:hypothetical protein
MPLQTSIEATKGNQGNLDREGGGAYENAQLTPVLSTEDRQKFLGSFSQKLVFPPRKKCCTKSSEKTIRSPSEVKPEDVRNILHLCPFSEIQMKYSCVSKGVKSATLEYL